MKNCVCFLYVCVCVCIAALLRLTPSCTDTHKHTHTHKEIETRSSPGPECSLCWPLRMWVRIRGQKQKGALNRTHRWARVTKTCSHKHTFIYTSWGQGSPAEALVTVHPSVLLQRQKMICRVWTDFIVLFLSRSVVQPTLGQLVKMIYCINNCMKSVVTVTVCILFVCFLNLEWPVDSGLLSCDLTLASLDSKVHL